MSVNGTIENGGEGMVYTHFGTMCGDELTQRTRDHYQAFDTDRLRYQIMDFRGVDRIEMHTDQIKETARLFCEKQKNRRNDHKFAIVLSNDPMLAVLKLWATYLEDPEVNGKIFYSMEEARGWIEQEDKQLNRLSS